MNRALIQKRIVVTAKRVVANGVSKPMERKVVDVDALVQKKGWRVRYACNFIGIPQTAYFRLKRKARGQKR